MRLGLAFAFSYAPASPLPTPAPRYGRRDCGTRRLLSFSPALRCQHGRGRDELEGHSRAPMTVGLLPTCAGLPATQTLAKPGLASPADGRRKGKCRALAILRRAVSGGVNGLWYQNTCKRGVRRGCVRGRRETAFPPPLEYYRTVWVRFPEEAIAPRGHGSQQPREEKSPLISKPI